MVNHKLKQENKNSFRNGRERKRFEHEILDYILLFLDGSKNGGQVNISNENWFLGNGSLGTGRKTLF